MKRLKSLYLPAAIVLMGVGAAVATNNAKSSDNALETGYYFDSSASQCIAKRSDCSPTGSVVCTWTDDEETDHNLSRKISDTMCGDQLYEP